MAYPDLPTAEGELGTRVDGVDDVLAADHNSHSRLIESLAGKLPRRFGDASNHLTIDPAQARIQAAGTARATRYLDTSLVGYKDFVHVTAANVARVRFNDNAEYTADWVTRVPPWVDITDDFTLYVPAQPCVENAVLAYRLFVRAVRPGVLIGATVHDSTQTTFLFDSVFGNSSTAVVHVPFVTFNGGVQQLQANDALHVNLTRYGGDAADTINAAWWVVASPFFEVKQKELA